jgi:uridine kinase
LRDLLLKHALTTTYVAFIGILIFCNDELTSQFDLKIFVDAPADIRLMRRIRRDCEERGRTPSDVLEQYHATVRPMHEEFVEPSKVQADLIVPNAGNSGLEGPSMGPLDKAVQVVSNHAKAMLVKP